MNNSYRRFSAPAGTLDMSLDAGLRSFMLGVYNKLALGLVWSGLLAYVFAYTPLADLLYVSVDHRIVGLTGLGMVARFAPLIVIFGGMFFMREPTPQSASLFYWGFVSLQGVGLSVWFAIYSLGSIAQVFFITAAAFGSLSLWGYVTKRDLTGFGSFLMMGFFGIIIAFLINMFFHSGMVSFLVSILGVLILSGLTAYDTQRLKMTYYEIGGDRVGLGVATSYGALALYLDFINLFQFLISLMGGNRR